MTGYENTDCSSAIMTITGFCQTRSQQSNRDSVLDLLILHTASHLSLLTSWNHNHSHLTQFTSVSSPWCCSLPAPTALSTAKCALEQRWIPLSCCECHDKKTKQRILVPHSKEPFVGSPKNDFHFKRGVAANNVSFERIQQKHIC